MQLRPVLGPQTAKVGVEPIALARGHAAVALPAIGRLHVSVVGRLHLCFLHLRVQLLVLVVR